MAGLVHGAVGARRGPPGARVALGGAAGEAIGADVGIAAFVQGVERVAALEKPRLTIAEQLRYRYLVSAEGNDAATNLAWAMASRSVVLMPRPRHETRLMQGLLRQWVHYVPLRRDFSDLGAALRWCRAHRPRCRAISANATRWVAGMSDPAGEAAVAAAVLRRFLRDAPAA